MTHILKLRGLNNRNEVVLTPGPRGQPRLGLGRGCVNILDKIGIEKSLSKQFLMFGNNVRQPAYTIPKDALLVFNEISDGDSHRIALKRAAKFCELAALPVINAPETVLKITPDQWPGLLQDLPGIRVPRTIRFRPESPQDIFKHASSAGFDFPFIVREAGDHTGASPTVVHGKKDERKLHACSFNNRDFFMTEFIAHSGEDGACPDQRILFVGGAPLGFLENEIQDAIRPALLEIHQRIGLDYFGLDCHIYPDRRILIFKISAGMDFFHCPSPEHKPLLNETRVRFREMINQKSGSDFL